MSRSGVCSLGEKKYSNTYQVIESIKNVSTDHIGSILAKIPAGITVSITTVGKESDFRNLTGTSSVSNRGDGYDVYRTEVDSLLKARMSQKRSSLQKKRYLTVTVKADSEKAVMSKFDEAIGDAVSTGKFIDVTFKQLKGEERLELAHDILHLGTKDKFFFDWSMVGKQGVSVKDFVAPSSIEINQDGTVNIGAVCVQVFNLLFCTDRISYTTLSKIVDSEDERVTNVTFRKVSLQEVRKHIGKHSDVFGYIDKAQGEKQELYLVSLSVMLVATTQRSLQEKQEQLRQSLEEVKVRLLPNTWNVDKSLMDMICLGADSSSNKVVYMSEDLFNLAPYRIRRVDKLKGLFYGVDNSNQPVLMQNDSPELRSVLCMGSDASYEHFIIKREMFMRYLFNHKDCVIILDPTDEFENITHKMAGLDLNIEDIGINFLKIPESSKKSKELIACVMSEIACGGRYNLNGLENVIAFAVDQNPNSVQELITQITQCEDYPGQKNAAARLGTALNIRFGKSDKLFPEENGYLPYNRVIRVKLGRFSGTIELEALIWLEYLLQNQREGAHTRIYVNGISELASTYTFQKYICEYIKKISTPSSTVSLTLIEKEPMYYFNMADHERITELASTIMVLHNCYGSDVHVKNDFGISDAALKYVQQTEENRFVMKQGEKLTFITDITPATSSTFKLLVD